MKTKEYIIYLVAASADDKIKNKAIMTQAEHGLTLSTKAITRKEVCNLLTKAFETLEVEENVQ